MAACLHVLLRFERWPHDLMYLIRVGYLPPVWHRLWGSFNNYVNIPAEATSPENGWHHGLRTPNEAFFHWNPELLGLGRQIGQINSGAFGVFFRPNYQHPVQWVPCPCFPLFNHYFYKKLSLYILIPNIYLELGFEFGSERIRDLAFMYP